MLGTTLQEKEQLYYFLSFCSFICLIHGKKLNLPNVFLLVLKNSTYRTLLKHLMSIDTDYEIVSVFIQFDPTLSKSKYISKYLNSRKTVLNVK